VTVSIIKGDCREVLRTLEPESVHCVVTSPPYWGLRDYGVDGQLGMEPCLGDYVDIMVDVFREIRRVLRADGTLWLNLGDSYAAHVNGRPAADIVNDDRCFRDKPFDTIGAIYIDTEKDRRGLSLNKGSDGSNHGKRIRSTGNGLLKPKDLCGIPWRVAFALQADGWWLRQDIIWAKPNPMPESVTDRCTKAHEYIFLLSKSERYFYDADATAERSITGDPSRPRGSLGANGLDARGRYAQGIGAPHRTGNASVRNKRSVWEIATAPFSEAHFATFPPALIEPCIKAGCPEGGTVLDPFGGAGTTGLVADRLGRHAILIELNPEYAAMAERRIRGDAGMFASVAAE
jgi:DNA modification methylase